MTKGRRKKFFMTTGTVTQGPRPFFYLAGVLKGVFVA